MVVKHIFGTMQQQSIGVYHRVQVSKPEMIYAGCTSILKASKISEYICNGCLYFWFSTLKKLLRVWCKENWNQVARIHWRWMEGSRDDHDILNFTGEKGPYFWSRKPFLQSQSRDETYSTSSTMTILKPRVDPLKKISIKQWRPVRIDIYYLSCFNRCHSWILTISLLCHHLSVSYGHGQPVYVQIPVKSPDTLWMMKNNIYCTLIRCNLSVQ